MGVISVVNQNKKSNFVLIMIVYLLGIFMGAVDTGIVTPARTIIQNNLLVDDKIGIWMITIYTLAYAASIPVMGKLADQFGRKYVYLSSIFLFGLGSLFCGLSQNFGSFTILLISRTVQAIGGGGILPVATAEFGTTFPKEKRGMALGLVGGVFGIANIVGATTGSAVLDLFGKNNWQFIFYINVPITLFILFAGFLCLPNTKENSVKKIDVLGIAALTVMVLSLLYGLKNIDFFDFNATFTSTSVYPYLIIFIVFLPLFIFFEKRAEDPVLNLSYFKNSRIVITLILSFITGIAMMGMIFVPQFCENALKIPSGSGGYFVLILGIFAGLGAPVSGKLIDKLGAKIILGFGFLISVIGSLFLILVTINYPNMLTVAVSLALIGTGVGFTMGTPLNYMMLDNTKKEESNSSLAAVSLVRSIGTAIAPAIMIGFLAHAGTNVQKNVMDLLPKEVNVPPLPYAQELTDELSKLKSDPHMKDKLASINMPDLNSMQKVKINMNSNSNYKMPKELVDLMKSSDVTTITDNCKQLSEEMFNTMTPKIISNIQNGITTGIDSMNVNIKDMDKNIADMQNGYNGIGTGIEHMQAALVSQEEALKQLENLSTKMSQGMPKGMVPGNTTPGGTMPDGIKPGNSMPTSAMNIQSKTSMNIVDMIPENVKSKIPQSVLAELKNIRTAEDLINKISELKAAEHVLTVKIDESKKSQAEMLKGMEAIKSAETQIKDIISKMTVLKNAVPNAFKTAEANYTTEIDKNSAALENEFQKTLNGGFKQVYFTVTVASILALIVLAFYKNKSLQTDL